MVPGLFTIRFLSLCQEKKAFPFETNHIFSYSKLNFHFPLVIVDSVLS